MELSQTIISLINSIKKKKGCVRCEFLHGMEDENITCLLEEWRTRKDFETHRQSECFKVLRGAMNLLGEVSQIISYRSLNTSERKKIGNPLTRRVL